MTVMVKAFLAWFVLLVLMFGNGVVRVGVLQPRLGEDVARRIASLTGVAIVLAFSGLFVRGLVTPMRGALAPRGSVGSFAGGLLGVGALWLALTLAFEFGFGHYLSGMSWQALLADYDLLHGRLWPLVLIATLLGPWLWGLALGRRRG
jgi:hypothetical protein